MLRMFGLAEGSSVNAPAGFIGWGSASLSGGTDSTESVDVRTGVFLRWRFTDIEHVHPLARVNPDAILTDACWLP
jgi:hypothetical protein